MGETKEGGAAMRRLPGFPHVVARRSAPDLVGTGGAPRTTVAAAGS